MDWCSRASKAFAGRGPPKALSDGDETESLVSGPGRVAGRTFKVEVDSGDRPMTVEVVGQELKPFTWEQLRPLPRSAEDEPAVVEGLTYPGEELAKAIFRAAPGEVAVAMNQPRTIAYVAQVTGNDYEISQPSGASSVYPSDVTLEKSPVRAEFLKDMRTEGFATDPQFAAFRDQLNPAAGRFRLENELDHYRSWRDGLYAEFGVENVGILDRADR